MSVLFAVHAGCMNSLMISKRLQERRYSDRDPNGKGGKEFGGKRD